MDNNTVDWRTELRPDSRQRIISKIAGTLNKRLLFSGQEGLTEIKKIAERVEENIYVAAKSQSDYLRKISLKILIMETNSHNPNLNSMPTNQGDGGNRPPHSGSASGLWLGDSESGYRPHASIPCTATTSTLADFCHAFENNCSVEESSQQFPHSAQRHNI